MQVLFFLVGLALGLLINVFSTIERLVAVPFRSGGNVVKFDTPPPLDDGMEDATPYTIRAAERIRKYKESHPVIVPPPRKAVKSREVKLEVTNKIK